MTKSKKYILMPQINKQTKAHAHEQTILLQLTEKLFHMKTMLNRNKIANTLT